MPRLAPQCLPLLHPPHSSLLLPGQLQEVRVLVQRERAADVWLQGVEHDGAEGKLVGRVMQRHGTRLAARRQEGPQRLRRRDEAVEAPLKGQADIVLVVACILGEEELHVLDRLIVLPVVDV